MLVTADGNDLHPITSGRLVQGAPSWSADGTRLVVERLDVRREQVELVTLGRDGSCPTQITRSLVSKLGPAWRPGSVPGPSNCTAGVGSASVREGPSFDASSSALSLAGVRAFRAFPLLWPGADARLRAHRRHPHRAGPHLRLRLLDRPRDVPAGPHRRDLPRRPRLGCARPRTRPAVRFRVRGVDAYRFGGWTQVPTGRVVAVLTGPRAAVRIAIARLRTASATRPRVGAGTRLPPPSARLAGPGCG